ncbi:MAG: type II toxin-antitoxin system RelE/ParE family toxin [Flavobacterium sp.]|nr:type II toxin-antitoxin system RelE/ParE family toxin [Flavobacterium sp.]
MSYAIVYRQRAAKEYLESLLWYKERSENAAENFVAIISKTLDKVAERPTHFKNTYKHFYEVSTKTFPFSIVYFIDYNKHLIVVVSIFHQKRNPRKKFRDK